MSHVESAFDKSNVYFSVAQKNSRISYLDGLRGIAILLVVSFHFYYILPTKAQVSYGLFIGQLILVKYGCFGVMLFFSISGFVICQTLHSSQNSWHFFVKRFARLFPTMLICSSLTFLFSFISPRIYFSTVNNFLPSLTFLDPQIYNALFKGYRFEWMDGAYWSLFTEVRFYAIACLIYFYDKARFLRNFLALSVIVGLLFPLAIYLEANKLRSLLSFVFIATQLSWFIFGIGCYYLHIGENKKSMMCTIISFLSLVFYLVAITKKPYASINANTTFISALIIYTLLFSAIKINIVGRFLSFKPLTAIGITSYSLYLLHQEIGEKCIQILSHSMLFNQHFSYFLPLFVLFILILVSSVLYKYYERPSNKKITLLFKCGQTVDQKLIMRLV